MSLSREISRKGEASGKTFYLEKTHPARMLRPSAGCSDSYHKYVLSWRDTNTPCDWPALSNAIPSSNTGFRKFSRISPWQ